MKEEHTVRRVAVWDKKAQQTVVIDVDVTLDVQWIAAHLGGIAYNNKKRQSFALGGLIKVKMRGTKVWPFEALV